MVKPDTKPVATTEEVVESTPPKKEIRSKSVQAVLDYREKIKAEIGNVKIDLAKKLADAAEIVQLLTGELGEPKDFLLKDPQFGQSAEILGIRPEPELEETPRSSMAPGGGAKRGRASDTKEKILEYAIQKEDAVRIGELAEKLGVAALTIRNNVKNLIAEKKLKEQGKDGREILYSVVR